MLHSIIAWLHGVAAWLRGRVAWMHGCMAAWLHGCMAWLHGCTPLLHGIAARLHGCMAALLCWHLAVEHVALLCTAWHTALLCAAPHSVLHEHALLCVVLQCTVPPSSAVHCSALLICCVLHCALPCCVGCVSVEYAPWVRPHLVCSRSGGPGVHSRPAV